MSDESFSERFESASWSDPLMVPLELLRIDAGTQLRATGVDDKLARSYADAMDEGERFPPVFVVDAVDFGPILAAGHHRYRAHVLRGDASMEVVMRRGTRRDAILLAVGENATHGKRRTRADQRMAIEALLRDEDWLLWSDRKIGRFCRADAKTIARVRAELVEAKVIPEVKERLVERGGKTYTMDTTGIGKEAADTAQHDADTEPSHADGASRRAHGEPGESLAGPAAPSGQVMSPHAQAAPSPDRVPSALHTSVAGTDAPLYAAVAPEHESLDEVAVVVERLLKKERDVVRALFAFIQQILASHDHADALAADLVQLISTQFGVIPSDAGGLGMYGWLAAAPKLPSPGQVTKLMLHALGEVTGCEPFVEVPAELVKQRAVALASLDPKRKQPWRVTGKRPNLSYQVGLAFRNQREDYSGQSRALTAQGTSRGMWSLTEFGARSARAVIEGKGDAIISGLGS